MYLETRPTESDIEYLEYWLREEYETFGEGLYSNRNLIIDSYQERQLTVFKKEDKAIELVSWLV